MAVPMAPPESRDISWNALAVNYLGILLGAYITHPVKSEMQGPDAIWFLLLKVVVLAILAAITVGIFSLFRRGKESGKQRHSFVIASWVFLLLSIWGAIPRASPQQDPQQVQWDQQPQPQAIAEATPLPPGSDYLQLRLSTMTDQQYQQGSAYWLSQHPDYASKEWIDALGRELQQVATRYPAIALGPAIDMALQRQLKLASSAAATQEGPWGEYKTVQSAPQSQSIAYFDPAHPRQLDGDRCPEHYILIPERGNLCFPVVRMTPDQAEAFNARRQLKQRSQ